jgi:hypothetical protein
VTKAKLHQLLSKWAPRLRLDDWNITIRFATTEEVHDDDRGWSALCTPYETLKEAEIVIVQSRYLTDDADSEVLVVHELLHLHMVPFRTKSGSLLEVAEENLVHALSTLLVALDRQEESVLGKRLPRSSSIQGRK